MEAARKQGQQWAAEAIAMAATGEAAGQLQKVPPDLEDSSSREQQHQQQALHQGQYSWRLNDNDIPILILEIFSDK